MELKIAQTRRVRYTLLAFSSSCVLHNIIYMACEKIIDKNCMTDILVQSKFIEGFLMKSNYIYPLYFNLMQGFATLA